MTIKYTYSALIHYAPILAIFIGCSFIITLSKTWTWLEDGCSYISRSGVRFPTITNNYLRTSTSPPPAGATSAWPGSWTLRFAIDITPLSAITQVIGLLTPPSAPVSEVVITIAIWKRKVAYVFPLPREQGLKFYLGTYQDCSHHTHNSGHNIVRLSKEEIKPW